MDAHIREWMKAVRNITSSELYMVGAFPRNYLLGRGTREVEIWIRGDSGPVGREIARISEGLLVKADENQAMVEAIIDQGKVTIVIENMNHSTIQELLHKRDFTIETLTLKVEADGNINMEEIIDLYGGLEDIGIKQIRSIHSEVFKTQPERMLKAIRLMAELDFDLEANTTKSIVENGDLLQNAPPEGVSEELFKILKCKKTHHYFNIMDKPLNILNKVFPEIEPMKEVGRCKYHVVDSWNHSLYTLNVAESIIYADGYFENHLRKAYEKHSEEILCHGHRRLELIKLAALFHDIGKPAARTVDETGRVRFRGHEVAGMEIVENIAYRLKFCDKERTFLCKLVREHMWPLILYKENDVSGRTIYDLFKNLGEDTLDVLLVSLADIIATRKLLNPHEEMGMYKVHIEYLANNYITRFKGIIDITHVIRENDIINNFSIGDKEEVNRLIEMVRKAIFFGKIPPEKNRAIKYLKEEILKH